MYTWELRKRLNEMVEYLGTEFNWGRIKSRNIENMSDSQVYFLNSANYDLWFEIKASKKCTIGQYEELTRIAGRKPKLSRTAMSYFQAKKWIEQYSKKVS